MEIMETIEADRRIRLVQVAYTSEWAVAKFFSALFNLENQLGEKYILKAITGGERDRREAWCRIIEEAEQRFARIKQQDGSKNSELNDLVTTLMLAGREDLLYFPFDRWGNTLPEEIYHPGFCDAVVIHSTNPSHLNYIRYALRYGFHVLCEKPLVPVIDSEGKATRRDLDQLIEINDGRMLANAEVRPEERRYRATPDSEQFSTNRCEKKKYVVAMDAEHYSAKKAALILFEHIGHMREAYGKIVNIEGRIDEIDSSENRRTRSVLSLKNRTGLLADTGVHLIGIITMLGGRFFTVHKAEYGMYPGYDVETSADVELTIFDDRDESARMFNRETPMQLHVAKFVDRKKTVRPENKSMTLAFENGVKVTVDFKDGTVCTEPDGTWALNGESHSNEYVTLLRQFYEAVRQEKEPRGSFSSSIKTLGALYKIYGAFPVKENCNKGMYQ